MSGCCQPAGAPARGELPPGTLHVVLVGRPNAGKSSLFNRLSGGSAHVGNFAGVTVELLEGRITLPAGNAALLVDLPGLYALSDDVPAGTDESIALHYLSDAARRTENLVVVQIADSTQLTASLGLFQTVRRLLPQARTLFVASQLDLLERDGSRLAVDKLADEIGSAAIAVNAREETTKTRVLEAIEETLRREALPPRSFEPDAVTKACLARPEAPTGISPRERSRRIDRVVLHPFVGPVIFLALMALLFSSVFAIADPVAKVCDTAVAWLGKRARDGLGGGLLGSAVADGVLGGAGTVAAFLPQVVLLVAGMELLEASGYLARGAFLVDRLFRVFGLGGKAFVPLLTGHACAVPAITATRVLRDPQERLTTILVLPLMTCSARLPVYGLVIAAFIGGGALRKAAVFTGLYVFAIVAGLFAAVVLRRTVTKGRGLPLALEMPDYRAPQLGAVFARCGREAKEFLRRVGTVIVVLALLLWAALKIPARAAAHEGEPVEARSVAAAVGHALEPISRPLGFDWRINVGLVASFGARELMVGTFGVIHGVEGADAEPAPLVLRMQNAKRPDGTPAYGLPTALSLLVFFVFACQCMSTLSAIRRETKSTKWAAFVLGYTYALAYVASLVTFQIARLLS